MPIAARTSGRRVASYNTGGGGGSGAGGQASRRALARDHSRYTTAQTKPANSDFVEFLHHLLDILFTPITYPLRQLRNLVTSPLTITVVIKALLLIIVIVASAGFSFLAVGAFWWSWGTGGNVEVEGWLIYGSRTQRMPHAVLQLPHDRFQEDLPYDVQVELELVRPSARAEETGNFMVTLELRSQRSPPTVILHAAQPSLPPPPLEAAMLSLPSFPTYLLPPCIIPWPFRGLCPSRILGYADTPNAKIKERRRRSSSPANGKEVVLLTKELVDAVVINPGRGDLTIGSAFVSIGREDTSPESDQASRYYREVRTTGWVVVRFVPHPTGIRWLLTSNPIPPLIILPPLSLGLAITSAVIGFIIISVLTRRSAASSTTKDAVKPRSPSRSETPKAPTPARRTNFADIPVASGSSPRGARDEAWEEIENRRWSGPGERVEFVQSEVFDESDPASHPATEATVTESGTGTVAGSVTERESETENGDDTESWESS
ncbi:uncharacterized protein LOC62_07G009082 [Vanrija pseudolonga]|uniref:Seipin n=1 Tax=Vanrija pseudolonga TaxID=143232 RepID=A0AAF0YJ35_9TREE|nr:hypothetical protein LOC62_07G009082 [Vanrija pseudolonga]